MRLTDEEQRHVRTALRFLRFRVGGWQPLADALGLKVDSLVKVDVTARLARLTDVSIDGLLAGALLSPRTCPHCGRPPDDFANEETVVEDLPREPVPEQEVVAGSSTFGLAWRSPSWASDRPWFQLRRAKQGRCTHAECSRDRHYDADRWVRRPCLEVLDRSWFHFGQLREALLCERSPQTNSPDVRGDRRQRMLDLGVHPAEVAGGERLETRSVLCVSLTSATSLRNDLSSMLRTSACVMVSLVVTFTGCRSSSEKPSGSTEGAVTPSAAPLCKTVAEHLVSLVIADTDRPGIHFVGPEAGPVILRVAAARCDQDRWSEDAKTCYLAMRDTNGWQACDAKLTGEQLAKIRAELGEGQVGGRAEGAGSSTVGSGTVAQAPTPVAVDRSAPWIERADKALHLMLDGNNRGVVAASIQSITHPLGSRPNLKSYDVRRMGDRISLRISVNWEGSIVQDAHGNGKAYATDVVWEFSEGGHVSAKVLSDTSLWGPDGAQRLDDWFRNELYPVLYRNAGG